MYLNCTKCVRRLTGITVPAIVFVRRLAYVFGLGVYYYNIIILSCLYYIILYTRAINNVFHLEATRTSDDVNKLARTRWYIIYVYNVCIILQYNIIIYVGRWSYKKRRGHDAGTYVAPMYMWCVCLYVCVSSSRRCQRQRCK